MPAAGLAQPLGISKPVTAAVHPFSLWIGGRDLIAYADKDSFDLQDPGGNQPATLSVTLTDPTNSVGLGIPRRARMRWTEWSQEPNAQQEIIVNNTFDTGFTGWTNGAGATLDTTNRIVNAQSLKLGPSGSYVNVRQTIVLHAGHTYTLQGWYMTDAAYVPNSTGFIALPANADYPGIDFTTSNTPWTFFAHTWLQTVEKPAQQVAISAGYPNGNTGNLWFDGLSLIDSVPQAPTERSLFDGFVKLIEPTGVANYAEWQVTATHVESLLDFLYIASLARPAESTQARIDAILANCLPAGAPLALAAGDGQSVVTPQDAATFANVTVRAAIEATLAGAGSAGAAASQAGIGGPGYYVDPNDWSLHTYLGVATGQAAPYAISDAPQSGQFLPLLTAETGLGSPGLAVLGTLGAQTPTTIPAALAPQKDSTAAVDAVYVRGGTTAGSGTVWAPGVPSWPAAIVAVDHPESRNADMLAQVGAAELALRTELTRLQAVVTGYDGWAKGQAVAITNQALGYAAQSFVITGLSIKALSGTGLREYTLQLGRGHLRLTSAGAVTQAAAAAKVTGAQLAAGTSLPVYILGSCTFDGGDAGHIYFGIPNLGNGYTVLVAFLDTHLRQFWAPATGTGSTTSAATTPGGVTSAGGTSHSHTTPNHAHLLASGSAGVPTIGAKAQFYNSGGAQSGPFVGTTTQADLYSSNTGGGSTSGSEASHSHSVPGSSHSHAVPAAGLAYGMFLEAMPASWSVTIVLEFYESGAWATVATFAGIAVLNDLGRDLSPYVTEPGEYRLTLQSAIGQPNNGRLVADVFGFIGLKLL